MLRCTFSSVIVSSIVALLSSICLGEPIRLGVQNHTWNSLYRDSGSADRTKLAFYEKNLDLYKGLGADWNVVRIDEQDDGIDGFRRLDAILRAHEKRNVEVVLRLIEDPDVYSRLTEVADKKYGHDKQYAEWVTSVAEYTRGRVRVLLIGNEADKDLSANQPQERQRGPLLVPYESYKKLLTTAYRAAKAANPDVLVADHGVESYSLLSAVVSDLIDKGQVERAIQFCRSAFWYRDEHEGECSAFPRRLARDATLHARAEKARLTFFEPGPADLFQVHLYISPDGLPTILDWIADAQRRNGLERSLIVTELGYLLPSKTKFGFGKIGWVPDVEKYSEMDHATDLVKSIVMLAASGVAWAEVWEIRSQGGNDSIVGTLYKSADVANELEPNKAAVAFTTLSKWLRGAELDPEKRFCNNQCREYDFSTSQGTISVLWTSKPDQRMTIDIRGKRIATVTSVLGEPVDLDGDSMEITTAPLVIQLMPGNSLPAQ